MRVAELRLGQPTECELLCALLGDAGYCARGWIGQNVCSARLLRPWKPKTCSLRSEDRLHPCPRSCECSAPTLRPRKQNHESPQFRASTRPHAACVEFESLSPLTMTLKVAIVRPIIPARFFPLPQALRPCTTVAHSRLAVLRCSHLALSCSPPCASQMGSALAVCLGLQVARRQGLPLDH